MLATALIVGVLAVLIFVVGGLMFGVAMKYLQWAMVAALGLVLAFILSSLPPSITVICLLVALVLSARLMFFRAP